MNFKHPNTTESVQTKKKQKAKKKEISTHSEYKRPPNIPFGPLAIPHSFIENYMEG